MTKQTGALTITTPSDRELVMTRVFDASRELVFKAMTTPDLLKRWLLGPPGWTMVVCDVDLRVGGAYRYVWQKAGGIEMGMGGVFREIVPPERLVQTETFDESWYPGEGVGTVVLIEEGGKTTMTQTMLYESKDARDAVLKSPMDEGVAVSYDRLADVLDSMK